MSETITEKWRCDACDTLHDLAVDAYNCCLPQISHGYVCQDCGTWHREKSGAAACCVDAEQAHGDPTVIPTTAQLEAIGQLRLVP